MRNRKKSVRRRKSKKKHRKKKSVNLKDLAFYPSNIDETVINLLGITSIIPEKILVNFPVDLHNLANSSLANSSTFLGKVDMKIALWPVNEQMIDNFSSIVNPNLTPMDCFINAMQLIGVFDTVQSNLLRITCTGGVRIQAIIQSLTYSTFRSSSNNSSSIRLFFFQKFKNGKIWITTIKETLENQKNMTILFAGYTGHVFCFARANDNRIYYLDPQLKQGVFLLDDTDELYQKYFFAFSGREYYIATKSKNALVKLDTPVLELMGFDFTPGRGTGYTTAHG